MPPSPRRMRPLPQTGRAARLAARNGGFERFAGLAPGYVQGPVAVLRGAGQRPLPPRPETLPAAHVLLTGRLSADEPRRRPGIHTTCRDRVFPGRASWSMSRPTFADIGATIWSRSCWMLVLVRGGPARGRNRAAPHRLQRHRSRCTAPTIATVAAGPVSRPDGRLHATHEAERPPSEQSGSRRALSCRARRRSCISADLSSWHGRPDETRTTATRCRSMTIFSACGVTPQSVVATVEPQVLHRPLSRRHARDRSARCRC